MTDKLDKRLNKKWFYEQLKPFNNKHLPISIDTTLNKTNLRFRIVFNWHSKMPNGDFNPMMSCQLIDTYKQGPKKYIVPDLIFNCVEKNVTTDYKLFKYLSSWIDDAFKDWSDTND